MHLCNVGCWIGVRAASFFRRFFFWKAHQKWQSTIILLLEDAIELFSDVTSLFHCLLVNSQMSSVHLIWGCPRAHNITKGTSWVGTSTVHNHLCQLKWTITSIIFMNWCFPFLRMSTLIALLPMISVKTPKAPKRWCADILCELWTWKAPPSPLSPAQRSVFLFH